MNKTLPTYKHVQHFHVRDQEFEKTTKNQSNGLRFKQEQKRRCAIVVEFEKVRQLFATACPVDTEEITMEKHLVRDLSLIRFGLLEMVMAFEDEFGIEIPDRDLRLFDTVRDVMVYLEEKQEQNTWRHGHFSNYFTVLWKKAGKFRPFCMLLNRKAKIAIGGKGAKGI